MSLANEFRDFIAGYTAITEIGGKKKDRERAAKKSEADVAYQTAMIDIQRQRLDMDRERLTRAGSGSGGAGTGLAERRHDLNERRFEAEQARLKAADDGVKFNNMADSFAGVQAPPVEDFDPADYWEPPEAVPALNRGGMVANKPHYRQGGMVAGEPDPELVRGGAALTGITPFISGQEYRAPRPQTMGAPASAVPVMTPAPVPVMTPAPVPAMTPAPVPAAVPAGTGATTPAAIPADTPMQEPPPEVTRGVTPEVPPEASRIVVGKAAEATAVAAKAFSIDIERPAAAVGAGSEPPTLDIAGNRGGLSMQEYQEAVQKIDPDGRIPAHLQSAAVLAEGYRYFQGRGELQKAEVFAQQILITQKQMSQTLGALSMQAIEAGDLASACRLFNDACNKFPSGHDINVAPDDMRGLTFEVLNDGEVIEKGRLNTEQLWEMATGVSNGSAFLTQVVQFATEQGARPKPPTAAQAIDTAVDLDRAAAEASSLFKSAQDAGVSGQELETLRTTASDAGDAARAGASAAVTAGASRSDLRAALDVGGRNPSLPETADERPKRAAAAMDTALFAENAALAARQAFENAEINGVRGAELTKLMDEAQSLADQAQTAYSQALNAGADRVQLNDILDRAAAGRIAPMEPSSLEEKGPGIIERIFGGRGGDTATPAPAPAAAPPVTSRGNPPAAIPTPTSRGDRNAPAAAPAARPAAAPAPAPAPSTIPVGTISGGYRFNGGNPNDQKSWTPVNAGAR